VRKAHLQIKPLSKLHVRQLGQQRRNELSQMMKTSNTTDLRRSSIMPGKGQLYKKSMKHGGKEEMAEMKAMKKKSKAKKPAKKKDK